MTADQELRSIIDRIIRVRDEVRDLNRDIREIYLEAKNSGYDKTALGKVVSYIEKRTADSAKVDEQEAFFDLYLNAYSGKSGTVRATRAHTHEANSDSDDVATSSDTPEELSSPAGGETDEVRHESKDTSASDVPPLNQAGQLPDGANASGPSSGQSSPAGDTTPGTGEDAKSRDVRTAGKSGKRSGGDRLPPCPPDPHRLGSFTRREPLPGTGNMAVSDSASTEIQNGGLS